MIIPPSSDRIDKRQLHPSFNIHSEYIHYIDIEYDEEEDRPDSFYYPYFTEKDELLVRLNNVFTNIDWKYPDEFCIIKTEDGILWLTIPKDEEGKIFGPINITVVLSDNPYVAVRRLCQQYNWYLFHFNSYSYLDIFDDSHVEDNLIFGDNSESDEDDDDE